jgi:uncharacterized coiled-coil DUF342 family protein
METVREKWTDERLDDMNARMGEGFDRIDKDIREVRSEVAGLRDDLSAAVTGVRGDLSDVRNDLRKELNDEVTGLRVEMSDRFEATHRLIVQVGAGLFGTMAMGFVGMVLTLILTQH